MIERASAYVFFLNILALLELNGTEAIENTLGMSTKMPQMQ